MILLAESGSTKTDWKLISESGIVESFTTLGINPAIQSQTSMQADQVERLMNYAHLPIRAIYFYGAGCGQAAAKAKVSELLSGVFAVAEVEVESDLLGAAKAIFDHRSGIACILGTGSNSGYYDGRSITKNVLSLGYLLGDEGGGSQIGKQLLTDYLRGNLPYALANTLRKTIGEDRTEIYQNVYQSPFPNRYLANVVGILREEHAEHPYFQGVVMSEFDRFFCNCISAYDPKEKLAIGFVGGIAFHFQDILNLVASNHGMSISNIIERPIDRLAVQYARRISLI
jgi:glucosamine kinase